MSSTLSWRKPGISEEAGAVDLAECGDLELIRTVGGSAVQREGRDLYRFEVAGKGLKSPLKMFAESPNARKDWIAVLRAAAQETLDLCPEPSHLTHTSYSLNSKFHKP